MEYRDGGSTSGAAHGRIIAYGEAELKRLPYQQGVFLCVRGIMPESGATIVLAPRLYDERPEYWGIEVVAIPDPEGGAENSHEGGVYERWLPLTGVTGRSGISVIGANRVTNFYVPEAVD